MTYRITYRKYKYDHEKGEEEIFTTEDVQASWLEVPHGGGLLFFREGFPYLFIEDCYRVERIDDLSNIVVEVKA